MHKLIFFILLSINLQKCNLNTVKKRTKESYRAVNCAEVS